MFRLNIGGSKPTFQSLYGGGVTPGAYDFTVLDKVMPHPVYAPQFFVCVLNPSEATSPTLKGLLAEACDITVKRHRKTERPK